MGTRGGGHVSWGRGRAGRQQPNQGGGGRRRERRAGDHLPVRPWLASCHYRNEHSRQLQYQRTTPQDPRRPRRFFYLSPSGPSVSSTGRSSRVYCMILSADTDTFSFRKTGLCFYLKKLQEFTANIKKTKRRK